MGSYLCHSFRARQAVHGAHDVKTLNFLGQVIFLIRCTPRLYLILLLSTQNCSLKNSLGHDTQSKYL